MIWGYHYLWKHPNVSKRFFLVFSNFLFKLGRSPCLLFRQCTGKPPSRAHQCVSQEFRGTSPLNCSLKIWYLIFVFHPGGSQQLFTTKNTRISSFSCQCHLCWFDIFCELNRCGWGWKWQSVRDLMTSAKYAHFVAESGKLCGAYTKGFTDKWIHVQQANDRCSCFFFLLIFYLRKMIHFDLILLMVQKSPTTTGLICLKPWRK